jgi:hypothetical protein
MKRLATSPDRVMRDSRNNCRWWNEMALGFAENSAHFDLLAGLPRLRGLSMAETAQALALSLVLLCGTAWAQGFDVGFDFRSTSGYVTDAACCTYVLGNGGGTVTTYPTTRTVNGTSVTFGWETYDINMDARDRSATYDARAAGIQFVANTSAQQQTFRVDLPSSGSYKIQLLVGDPGGTNAQRNYLYVYDNASLVFTLNGTAPCSTDTSHFADVNCSALSPSANLGTLASSSALSFASTILRVKIGTTGTDSNSSTIVHLRITAAVASAQSAFRFRNDNGSESAATWLAAENTNITQPLSTNTRLRAQVDTSGTVGSQQYQLEWKKSTDAAYRAVLTAAPSQAVESWCPSGCTHTATTTFTWTAPADVFAVKAECVGGGGAGGRRTSTSGGAAGGGGGAMHGAMPWQWLREPFTTVRSASAASPEPVRSMARILLSPATPPSP